MAVEVRVDGGLELPFAIVLSRVCGGHGALLDRVDSRRDID